MQNIRPIPVQAGQVALLSDPKDLLYLTGIHLSRGLLLYHRDNAMLFVDGRYIEKVGQTNVPVQLYTQKNVQEFLQGITFTEVVVDPTSLTYQQFEEFHRTYFDKARIINERPVKKMRLKKDPTEIEKIRVSAQLNYEGYQYSRKSLKEGMSEKEVAWEFEKYCRDRSAAGVAFPPIVAFGDHTAMPHFTPTDRKLQKGDPVILDFGVVVEGYCSDLTRSFLFQGEDPDYEYLAKMVRKAHHVALQMCRPGVAMQTLDVTVRQLFKSEKVRGEFKHNLGHSVGLEVHEYPTLRSEMEEDLHLAEGQVFAIEPALYQAGKWGYRHEDLISITDVGYENFYPEEDET